MSEFTTIHLGQSVKNLENSPSLQPFSMVRIIVGEDSAGNQVVYEAGEPSGRVLEVTNPYGTQQIANDMLSTVLGYQYKPYTADGALMNPAAELGDAVTVGDVYSVINSTETTFSPIMSSTISAHEDSTIDHEFPYQPKENREIARRIGGLRTSFTVELGKIERDIAETYETKDDAITVRGELENTITDTARGTLQTVSETYQTITDSQMMEERLSTTIDITARSITSTVAESQSKYDTSGLVITLYGYGEPTARASEYRNKIYLDQSSGFYYISNGSQWVKSSSALRLITNELSSRITQTAENIRAEVFGTYADEWTTIDSSGYQKIYRVDDIVKVTNGNNIVFYKCIQINAASASTKPPNSTYWEVTSAPSVESIVDVGINGISLSYRPSTLDNSATIVLNKDGIQMDAQTITMTNVVADSISANAILSDNIGLKGAFSLYNSSLQLVGSMGTGYGYDGSSYTEGAFLSGIGNNYVIATSSGVRMQSGNCSIYVTPSGCYASNGTTTKNLLA